MQWTTEQQAILAHAATGAPGKVLAYAGTGKTTTLTGIAEALAGRRVLYLAFNRVTAQEAQARFPAHVTAKTAHALAFAATRAWRGYRPLEGSWWRLRQALASTFPDTARGADGQPTAWFERTESQVFQIVAGTLAHYCQSADSLVLPRHVPADGIAPIVAAYLQPGWDERTTRQFAEEVRSRFAALAQRAWDALLARADWPITHDVYLKVWQLSHPALPADVVLFDEAQDANPVMQDLVLQHAGPVWMVGDSYQAIYAWRGAVDALDQFPAPAFPLSQSWRFGPAVAATAGEILDRLWQAAPPLTGLGPPGRVLGAGPASTTDPGYRPVTDRDQEAVICRTNIGVFMAAVAHLQAGDAVAVAGGADDIASLIESAVALYRGGRARHRDLRDFATWDDLEAISDTELGQQYRPIVRLVRQEPDFAARAAVALRTETVPESAARVVVSTGHKAKGRQWPGVRLADDWRAFVGVHETGEPWVLPEEARLWYVALTRAQRHLDLTAVGGAWNDFREWPGPTATVTDHGVTGRGA